MSGERFTQRLDDAHEKIAQVAARSAANTARLDGINGQIERLANAQEATRNEVADVRENLSMVATRTSIVAGIVVAVMTSIVGGVTIWSVNRTLLKATRSPAARVQPQPAGWSWNDQRARPAGWTHPAPNS